MKVFVAGGTGAIGKALLPQLIERGHDVVALVRSPERGLDVSTLGARPVVADPLDRTALATAIVRTRPDVIVHQLTALTRTGNFRTFDKDFTLTNRFRIEVTDTMLAAAKAAGTRRFIAQSFCGWPFAREGGPVKTEEDRLDPAPPASFNQTLGAIRYLERAVQSATGIDAIALRYGLFYGPGTGISADGPMVEMVRKRRLPIVGDGAGIWSFVHIDDAATATVAAVAGGPSGIYNVVDDEPARVSTWLPFLASVLHARPPFKIPVWLGRLAMGEGGVSMMTQIRGASNAKAKRLLGWEPRFASWRRGFVEGLAQRTSAQLNWREHLGST